MQTDNAVNEIKKICDNNKSFDYASKNYTYSDKSVGKAVIDVMMQKSVK